MAAPRASSEETMKRLIGQLTGLSDGPYCDYCVSYASELKKLSPDEIEQAKDQFLLYCEMLVGSADTCEHYIDMALDELKTKTPEEFCAEVGLC